MYPTTLASLRNAPIALFTKGNSELLHAPGVGMCGSRNASPRGLSAAAGCGEEVAGQRLAIVSGYAKGVDTETHLAALRTGGSTVIVLAEGIGGFRQKRAFDEVGLDPDRVLVVSQFPPTQRWTAGAAMTRNGVIAGLGLALVVIEAGEKGGTLNAGSQALRMQRPVLALEFESMDTPAGNQLLIRDGAMPVRSRADLRRALEVLRGRPMGEASEQLAFLRD
jgi:DNA processing protein